MFLSCSDRGPLPLAPWRLRKRFVGKGGSGDRSLLLAHPHEPRPFPHPQPVTIIKEISRASAPSRLQSLFSLLLLETSFIASQSRPPVQATLNHRLQTDKRGRLVPRHWTFFPVCNKPPSSHRSRARLPPRRPTRALHQVRTGGLEVCGDGERGESNCPCLRHRALCQGISRTG